MVFGTQFRLRTLLVSLMLAALVLGSWSARCHRQSAVVRQLREAGATISYGDSVFSILMPQAVTRRLPDDFRSRVIGVSIPQGSAFSDCDAEPIFRLSGYNVSLPSNRT